MYAGASSLLDRLCDPPRPVDEEDEKEEEEEEEEEDERSPPLPPLWQMTALRMH
jgi:hypothetical protein